MKKSKQILFATFLFFNVALHSQDWVLDATQSYEFYTTDQVNHDSKWDRGTPWGVNDKCGYVHYGPNNPLLDPTANYIWDVATVSNSANQHIKYVTTGGRQCLKLLATDGAYNPFPGTCPSPTGDFQFMSGQIISKAAVGPYCKVEICAKLPKEKGLWYSGWLFNGGGTEWDIFEFGTTGNPLNNYGQSLASPNAPQMGSNYHTWNNMPNANPCSATNNRNGNVSMGTDFHSIVDLSLDFHIYSYECTPTYIKIKLDGQLAWMISRDKFPYLTSSQSCTGLPQDYWPQQMNIILGLSTLSSMPPDPGQTNELLVDYVRVYNMNCTSYVNCDKNTTIKDINNAYQVDLAIPKDINYDGLDELDLRGWYQSTDNAFPYITPNPIDWTQLDPICGKNIGYYTGASVPYMDVKASNIITMHPGFKSDATGSTAFLGIPTALGVVYRAQIVGSCSTGESGGRSQGRLTNNALVPDKNGSPDIDITISPNPGNGVFNVSCSKEDNYLVEVFDMMGKKVEQAKFNGMVSQVDITKYNAGLYFFKVYNSEGNTTKILKIVKE